METETENEREKLIADVNLGIDQLERGEGIPFDIDAIKAELHRRLDEKLRP
jgi:hypothetical protein